MTMMISLTTMMIQTSVTTSTTRCQRQRQEEVEWSLEKGKRSIINPTGLTNNFFLEIRFKWQIGPQIKEFEWSYHFSIGHFQS